MDNDDKKYINEKIEDYPQLCLAIIMGLNLFGFSNSIFRLLEIDFFQHITFKGNFIKALLANTYRSNGQATQ